MPIKGFIDPRNGLRYPTDEYLEMSRSGEHFLQGFPYHYAALKTMAEERDVKGVSATELLSCARRWYLEREFDYYINPAERWRLYRGTSIHSAIELQTVFPCRYCNGMGSIEGGINDNLVPCTHCSYTGVEPESYIAEKRYYRTVQVDGDTVPISGQVDIFWPRLGVIADHKDKTYAKVKDDVQPEHILQMSIYAWIIKGDPRTRADPAPTKGGIYYQDGTKPLLKTFDLIPLADIEAFVVARLREHLGYGNGNYPAILQDEEDVKKMCKTCAVRDICAKLAKEGK